MEIDSRQLIRLVKFQVERLTAENVRASLALLSCVRMAETVREFEGRVDLGVYAKISVSLGLLGRRIVSSVEPARVIAPSIDYGRCLEVIDAHKGASRGLIPQVVGQAVIATEALDRSLNGLGGDCIEEILLRGVEAAVWFLDVQGFKVETSLGMHQLIAGELNVIYRNKQDLLRADLDRSRLLDLIKQNMNLGGLVRRLQDLEKGALGIQDKLL